MRRIDQKTCVKCVKAAGLIPYVFQDNKPTDEAISCIPSQLESTLDSLDSDEIVAVMSVTSCFAPRVPDDVKLFAKTCHKRGLPHVINNAYGL